MRYGTDTDDGQTKNAAQTEKGKKREREMRGKERERAQIIIREPKHR